MKAILIKLVKTEKQKNKLDSLIIADHVNRIVVKPALPNGNLHLKIFDEFGRDYCRELDKDGKLHRTNYNF